MSRRLQSGEKFQIEFFDSPHTGIGESQAPRLGLNLKSMRGSEPSSFTETCDWPAISGIFRVISMWMLRQKRAFTPDARPRHSIPDLPRMSTIHKNKEAVGIARKPSQRISGEGQREKA